MREIKFRAVIPERNAKIIFTLDDLIMAHLQKELFSIREILIPWLLVGNTPDRYTCLKDKNGEVIYEGDIIKCTDDADEIDIRDSDTGIGCVEWNEKYAFWSISKIENGLGDILQKGYVEIMGNKYENPELLI